MPVRAHSARTNGPLRVYEINHPGASSWKHVLIMLIKMHRFIPKKR